MDRRGLIARLRAEFALDWRGIHGAAHWARVRSAGLGLAGVTEADREVVELFALLHDARRLNDGSDPEHGGRAAELAVELNGRFFALEPRRLGMLVEACRDHTRGRTRAERTIQTCWDADRLDLGRIGIRPEPDRLCTAAARDPEAIERAWQRSGRWARSARRGPRRRP